MAGKDRFLFKGKVGVFDNPGPMEFKPPVEVIARLAQNGFKLHYKDKDFVATTLDEAMKMIKVWFENEMRLAEVEDLEEKVEEEIES